MKSGVVLVRAYFSVPSNISSRNLANRILKEAGLPKAF